MCLTEITDTKDQAMVEAWVTAICLEANLFAQSFVFATGCPLNLHTYLRLM